MLSTNQNLGFQGHVNLSKTPFSCMYKFDPKTGIRRALLRLDVSKELNSGERILIDGGEKLVNSFYSYPEVEIFLKEQKGKKEIRFDYPKMGPNAANPILSVEKLIRAVQKFSPTQNSIEKPSQIINKLKVKKAILNALQEADSIAEKSAIKAKGITKNSKKLPDINIAEEPRIVNFSNNPSSEWFFGTSSPITPKRKQEIQAFQLQAENLKRNLEKQQKT